MDPPSPSPERAESDYSPILEHIQGEDERQRQQERLNREEAYYQFINGLSEEDYRLMRDSNLLGTPGEITAEELRQRLDGAKERLSSQPGIESNETLEENLNRGSDVSGENSNGDSLLEWLNTFRRTGNATRSGQSGNQTWRAVSRTNPNSGEFRFSLEININHDQQDHSYDSGSEQATERATLLGSARRGTESRRSQRSIVNSSRRTRNSVSRLSPGPQATGSNIRMRSTNRTSSENAPSATEQRIPRNSRRGRNRSTLYLNTAQRTEEQPRRQECPVVTQDDHRGDASLTSEDRSNRSRNRTRINATSVGENPAPRRQSRTSASRRSRSPLRRSGSEATYAVQGDVEMDALSEMIPNTLDRTETVNEEREQANGSSVLRTASAGVASEVVSEEAEINSSSSAGSVRRHPTIMLDLQVRRIRPGENRDRDSIANRTRSRVRMAENTVTFESDSGGFRRTISRSERAGIRTYVSTIRIPLRRISETGLGEPSSVALRSILRQIMTGFGELSSLMETEADSDVNSSTLSLGNSPEATSFQIHSNVSNASSVSLESRQTNEDVEEPHRISRGLQSVGHNSENRENRQSSRDTNNLVENGTLPILRLAHFFLLNDEDDDEHPRGLTKEQIDNLSTRNYGEGNMEAELSKTCSVCINEYAAGNKLRRLPCAHEFHIHCIDRWLSENSTCPICRQPVLGSRQT
ncbi:E3 ubiquitin-protein ligase RNF6 [Erpetoichthys calabaricus]|uniref:RING-type E3 ubiquitin transferase n=1 Tax=Erpetoichthys calabaricus TaxID=27687 RepID=A0A8C4S4T0_ERPCA|nr:E3 ubiquitin-protein ligase RNF6 [Erpetoichthys calabaricus]